MRKPIVLSILLSAALLGCQTNKPAANTANTDSTFKTFETSFLDAYFRQYPSISIASGYGKYYDKLIVPDSNAFAGNLTFSRQWLDSLQKQDYTGLTDNSKISFNILKHQLESDTWYDSVFREYEWNPAQYNLAGDCDYILNQPYAPLDQRLAHLSHYLENATAFYQNALKITHQPVREFVELAIKQNQGGISLFGASLSDSINSSHLSETEKAQLKDNIAKTVTAIKDYVAGLRQLTADPHRQFRPFAIGKELYTQKFNYDLATDLTPEQIYASASADEKKCYDRMFLISDSLWPKYFAGQPKLKDTLSLIQALIDKISLQHAAPDNFFDSLTNQLANLNKFIVQKDLFAFDTTNPIKVRLMPEYERGVVIASAEFSPPYLKQGDYWYNVDDLTKYPKEKAESALREVNNYTSQLLSIHEAVPGHCLQGVYANLRSPDVLRAVFANGAMGEGWAVYAESMMLENGWGNGAPEMELMYNKLKLRELSNVIIDYDIQCLQKPKEYIMDILEKQCFQTKAQAEEKYHRATVSQVQLCSYYAGATAIRTLRDEYKTKLGAAYTLKGFHEKFLSYGSSPVKYIREQMLHTNP
jgi:uncharacterized protein (DUF885 family)